MTTAIVINANDGVTRNVMAGGETEVDFDFPIYAATHIEIFETDTNGDITQLVKDTDFTVPAGSVNQQAGGTCDLDGTVYPSGATAGHVFTAYQAAPYARTTDFNQAGDFFADTLNQELDLITQQIQQIRRDLNRAPLAPVDTTLTSLSLPDPADGFGLVWDGTAGAIRNTTASIANLEGDAETVADNIGSINTVAADLDGSDTIGTVAGIAANVTTVAGIAANVTTVAGISANVTTVAGISANVTTVANNDTNITTVATNIATVVQAAEAVASALAFTFDNSTTMADPGTGDIRLNNASFASVTAVAVDALTAQSGNPDLSDFIATWDDSTNPTTKGYIRLSKGGAPENFAIYQITAVTDNTGWLQLTVTHVDSAGSFTAADTLYLTFTRTGDQGSLTASGNNDFTGDNTFAGTVAFKDDGELTIATGAITITGASHTVDTESDAASDDLDTINGGTDGDLLVLRAENAARTVVLKDGTGNIETQDGSDITLDETEKICLLQYDAALSKWLVLSSPPAAGGGEFTKTAEGTITAQETADFTNITKTTKFKIFNLSYAGGNNAMELLLSTNNGSSFLATGYWQSMINNQLNVTTTTFGQDNYNSGTELAINLACTDEGFVEVTLHEPDQTGYTMVEMRGGGLNVTDRGTFSIGYGFYADGTSAIDAIRFVAENGTGNEFTFDYERWEKN